MLVVAAAAAAAATSAAANDATSHLSSHTITHHSCGSYCLHAMPLLESAGDANVLWIIEV